MKAEGFKTFHLLLALGMLITGSVNTISTKAADLAPTTNRYGESVKFNHPFFQALCMFLGEFLCLLVFFATRARAKSTGAPFSALIFATAMDVASFIACNATACAWSSFASMNLP